MLLSVSANAETILHTKRNNMVSSQKYPFVIGICGYKETGKSTLAKAIQRIESKERHISNTEQRIVITQLSSPVKKITNIIVQNLVGFGTEDLFTLKESDWKNKRIRVSDFDDSKCAFPTIRNIMQRVGTEVARSIHPTLLTTMCRRRILNAHETLEDLSLAIIDDVRFRDQTHICDMVVGILPTEGNPDPSETSPADTGLEDLLPLCHLVVRENVTKMSMESLEKISREILVLAADLEKSGNRRLMESVSDSLWGIPRGNEIA